MNEVELALEYDPRVASLHLGERKYTTPSRAIGELVANAFDAGASRVSVEIVPNELGGDASIRVQDNGRGMTPSGIRNRFARVGVEPTGTDDAASAFGRFGVGRFAAHRLGTDAVWTTTARDQGQLLRSSISLTAERPNALKVRTTTIRKGSTGTVVEIHNLREPDKPSLAPAKIAADLAAQFCAFLLGHPDRILTVQGLELNVEGLIESRTDEELDLGDGTEAAISHLVLKANVDRSRFPAPLLYSAKGQTVAVDRPDFTVSPNYLGLVEWGYLEEIVSANREAILDLDPRFKALQEVARDAVAEFQSNLKDTHTRLFLREARIRNYYPFKGPPSNALAAAQRVMYDAVLTEVNDQVNLEAMTQRQQAVVFKLLLRALENEDLVEILGELVDVPDAQLRKFRQVLSRTTLDSVIRLSTEVTNRLEFLDQLHELIYGNVGKHVLERAHLHKFLEPYAWLFGEPFHLATSDQAFRSVIARHRAAAGLPMLVESVLSKVQGIDQIPDLFLVADKEYPQKPTHRRLLVEIKAPKVAIGKREIDQVQKYADVLLDSAEFDADGTEWDVFLVSADLKDEVQRRRESPDRPFGMIDHVENVRSWVFRWSEIIGRARDELRLVREHLGRKSAELSLDYWAAEFPEIAEGIQLRVDKAALRIEP